MVAKNKDRTKRVAVKKDQKRKLVGRGREMRAALTQLNISPHYYAGKRKIRQSLSTDGCEILRHKVQLQPLRLIN